MKSHSNVIFTRKRIKIFQYNVNKSFDIMHFLLKFFELLNYDILTIQKSWKNTRQSTIHNFFSKNYHLIFLFVLDIQTQICIYVNIKLFLRNWSFRTHNEKLLSITLKFQTFN